MSLTTTTKIVMAMLLWALCFPLITAGLQYSPHLTFATLRAVLAGVALVLIAIFLRRPIPHGRRTWLTLCVVGVGGKVWPCRPHARQHRVRSRCNSSC